MKNEKITYRKAAPSNVTCTVELKKGASDVVFPHANFGLIVPVSAKKAGAVGWEDVVHHLKWALERSPEMRADLKQIIANIEAANVV